MAEFDSDETNCDELEINNKIQAKESENKMPLYIIQNVQRFLETCGNEIASYLKQSKPFDKAKLEFNRCQLLEFAQYDLDYNLRSEINKQLKTLSELTDMFDNLFFKENVEDDIKAVKDLDMKFNGGNCYKNFWDSSKDIFGSDFLTNQNFTQDDSEHNDKPISRKRSSSQRVYNIDEAVTAEIETANKADFTFDPQLNPGNGILFRKEDSSPILNKKPRKAVTFSDRISYSDGNFSTYIGNFSQGFVDPAPKIRSVSDIIVIDPKEQGFAFVETLDINKNMLEECSNFDLKGKYDKEINIKNDTPIMQVIVNKSEDSTKDLKRLVKLIDEFYTRFKHESNGLLQKYGNDNIDGIITNVIDSSSSSPKNDSKVSMDTKFFNLNPFSRL